ncbi:MAG: 2OG-Fe(II) oxygenase [Rhodobacteraceae bacterium]|nr:2OG-Fe(II) oxygenase [Paracoccaceae bacterium]
MAKNRKSIPIIDVAELLKNRASPDLLKSFYEAYNQLGFGYIINHGIDPALIEKVFDASNRFHAMHLSEKMKVALDHKHRGYIAINTSTDVNSKLETIKKPNQSASFMTMREDKIEDPKIYLSGPNQWPELENFRAVIEEYTTKLEELANNLLRAALLSTGVKDLSVMKAFEKPTTWLRLLHYPSLASDSPVDLYGSAPHTDFGCLTFLAQDNIGGLQVQAPDGEWLNVPKLENSFVVNVGDMLHRMSNGLLRSTPHRVVNRSGSERYSCVFFYDPNVSFNIKPLKGTGKPKFKSLNFGEFLREELVASYEKHKAS